MSHEERPNGKPEPRFDLDYEVGRQAEMWVSDIREALKSDTIEVKRDRQTCRTGNIYVEFQCFKRGQWANSGISTTTAKLWFFVLVENEFGILITTQRLKEIARDYYLAERVASEKDGSHPTRGVLIPVKDMLADVLRRGRQ